MTYPVLDENLTQSLYKLISSIRSSSNVKIGVNESIKSINKKESLLVVVAVDAIPESIIGPLPTICELNAVECVFVGSKSALGKACKLSVDVVACSIVVTKNENPEKLYKEISKFK